MAERRGRGTATTATSDFYAVLRQSILDRGLADPEAREAAYAQARRAMVNRLWSFEPPLAEDEIDHRIGQFDIAVARIEDDVATVFAEREAERQAEAEAATPPADEAEEDYPAAFGGTPGDTDEGGVEAPGPAKAKGAGRSLDEASLAVERALNDDPDGDHEDDDERDETDEDDLGAGARFGAHDEDVAGWTGPHPDDDPQDADRVAPGVAASATRGDGARRQVPRSNGTGPKAARPDFLVQLRQKATAALPVSETGQLRLLVGVVVVLAVLLVSGLVLLILPGTTTSPQGTPPVVLQTEVPGGVSDPATAIRLPKEAISVTSSFTLFDGRDPTAFSSDPGNPVRFDGQYARIATSAASSGARVIIGAGLSSRLAGRVIRVTIDARSARENGATSMRFAYQSGVAISHWQTANLAADFTELGLVWRVPTMRTSPEGDYIVIEPGIPGSGSAVEIRSVRIDLVDP